VDGEPVGCPECAAGEFAMPKYNIRQLCYDPHQIEDMCQGFRKEGLTWVKVFNQNDERLVADSMMYGLARQGRLTHDGNSDVRQHIAGASMKVSKDDDTKLRIIKRNAESKIDAAVAISMGVKRCLDLQLTPAAASTELTGAQ
jgi:phage terminase large subunit-like protein